MAAKLTEARCLRVKRTIVILLLVMVASPLCAVKFEGCSWTGPKPDWTLDRTLPWVDVVGSLGSREVMGLLHDSGASISFIAGAGEDPTIRYQSSGPTTVRELVDEMIAETPGYRLDVVGDKLVIYPVGVGYDALVEIGDYRKEKRVMALGEVLRELRSKSPVPSGLRLPTLRPFSGYGDLISVGGVRTVVEHLVSLVAGSPSASFLIRPRTDGSMQFSLMLAKVIDDLILEAPKKVEVGAEFQVVPRVFLVDGTPVTLIGSGCGVRLESDESLLKIDQGGRAVAVAKGTGWIQAKYAGITVQVEIEVGDD